MSANAKWPSRRTVLAGLSASSAWPISVKAADKVPVVASFSILGDFLREIGGERIALTVLVGPNGDAHVYTPTPADARKVKDARLIVLNGLRFEGWTTRLIRASASKARVVEAAEGVATIVVDENSPALGLELSPQKFHESRFTGT